MEKNQVLGKEKYGSEVVLSEIDDDLSRDCSWGKLGYTIEPFLSGDLWKEFSEGFKLLFRDILISSGFNVPERYVPEDYHEFINNSKDGHLRVVEQTKLFQASQFPIELSLVEERISEILGFKVKSIKPLNQEQVFHFRVIRPGQADYNPIHRDVWQEENRNAINIYVPLAGSNSLSSLRLVPGSHKWPESATVRSDSGAEMNSMKFNVPGLMSSSMELDLVRSNPEENEVLLFSPYLLHGLSENTNKNLTRISLEMRFWRAY